MYMYSGLPGFKAYNFINLVFLKVYTVLDGLFGIKVVLFGEIYHTDIHMIQ